LKPTKTADLLIVGAGPTGLSAAVNASSEGLTTIVVEAEDKIGGQAKESSRIENYLGFPSGLTGPKLMSRAFHQAMRFGTKFLLGVSATRLHDEGMFRVIDLSDGSHIISVAVLLANGLQWKRLEAAGIEEYTGKGVFYGLNMDNAHEFLDKEVVVIGGANSACQAATWLAKYARKVYLIVRAKELAASQYLVERISRQSNIELLTDSELTSVSGEDGKLKWAVVRQGDTVRQLEIDGVFIFIGAIPRTNWLNGQCEVDADGFLKTSEYQTTCPGVFAAGDIRAGSTKRIAAGVGEGAVAVARIHAYLAEQAKKEKGE